MGTLQEPQAWNPRTVGIALAAYKPNPTWLAEQLESIVVQTHTEWICIITLDSPIRDIDSHPRIIPFFNDPRFTWIENSERMGIRRNFEKAIALAAANNVDLLSFSDQDDIWLPEKLSMSIASITDFGPMSVVATDAYLFVGEEVVSETLNSLHRINQSTLNLAELIIYPSVSGFTMLVDSRLVKLHPLIPESILYHDHWFSVAATAYGGVKRLDTPLAFYRQHESNMIGIKQIRPEIGLSIVETLGGTSERVRERGRLQLDSARAVAHQLPMSPVLRTLYMNHIGWMLVLLAIIAQRSFSEKRLVVQANRALFAQLLVFPSQAERIKALRSWLPIPKRLLKLTALAVCTVLLSVGTLHAGAVIPLALSAPAPLWWGLAAVALLIPAWKFACHLYPNAGLALVGLSAALAGFLRIATDSPMLSVLAFTLPVAWYLAYRIRWRGDTGF